MRGLLRIITWLMLSGVGVSFNPHPAPAAPASNPR